VKWAWWLFVVVWAGFIFWLSSSPDAHGGIWLIEVLPFGDKLAHAFVFGVLATLLGYATGRWRLALIMTALYGLSDELHQSFVPNRSVDVTDWMADTIGAICALGLVKFFTRLKRS
jgi:VanZ family protein